MATNITITTSAEPTNYTLSTGARGPRGLPGGGAVTSVAGRTGDVTLVSADIGDRTFDAISFPGQLLTSDGIGAVYAVFRSVGGDESEAYLEDATFRMRDPNGTTGVTLSRGTQTAVRAVDFPDASGTLMLGDGESILKIISLTQAEYDAITPSSTTLYVIV